MICIRKFVEINHGGNYDEMDDEEKAYWEMEYDDTIAYDRAEQRGKDRCKYGSDGQ